MSFGITELVIILVIVLLLFGTTKLKSLGSDLGAAIKGFRSAVTDDEGQGKTTEQKESLSGDKSPGAAGTGVNGDMSKDPGSGSDTSPGSNSGKQD